MTRFYIEGAEEFDRACRLLDKRDVPYDIDGGDSIMVEDCYATQVIGVFELFDIDYEEVRACCDLTKSVPKSLVRFVVPSLKTKHPALSGAIRKTVAC